ncbi:uncharacterized protein [Triticum aestivum]|nr:uncharacterized protein LOC123039641 [Triticum aestivum]
MSSAHSAAAHTHSLVRTPSQPPPPPPLPLSAPTPESGRKMALSEIPDELLVEILLGLPTPEDLIRASAACVSFRRLVADRAFLRRFRKLHPAPLLGFLDYKGFHPAEPPHPSAPAARADGPSPAPPTSTSPSSPPPTGSGTGPCGKSATAASSSTDPAAIQGTSFRVIWMLLLKTKPMAAVFSSSTGQWRAITSLIHSDSLPGFALSTWKLWFVSRHYAHGCFYWVSGTSEKLLVLDIRTMEFSMVDHPPCARYSGDDVAIVEAGQGITLMFVPKPDTSRLIYTVWRNNGGSSTHWQMQNEPFSLDSGSVIKGAVGRHLLLYYGGSSSVERGCYTRVCGSYPDPSEAYCNFPPSLLSSPRVSSGTRHADAQGAGDDLLVPELREAYPGGVQGPVLAAAAHAPNLLFVIEGTRHADAQGAGDDLLVPEL